jgi:hypothetical protein
LSDLGARPILHQPDRPCAGASGGETRLHKPRPVSPHDLSSRTPTAAPPPRTPAPAFFA